MRFIIALIFAFTTSFALAAQPPLIAQDLISNNILVNPGFENGKYGWTASGGATAAANATAVGLGTYGYDWDSNGAAQTLLSNAVTIPNGLRSKQGVAFCKIKAVSGTPTHTITVNDGSNDLVSAQTIATSTSEFTRNIVYFKFPSSGSVKIKIASVAADEPEIYIDDCFLGDAFNVVNVSQAKARVSAKRVTTAQSVSTTSYTTIIYNDDSSSSIYFDRFSELNTTTGVFTSKEAITAVVSCRSYLTNYTSNELAFLQVLKNGSTAACSTFNTISGTDTGVSLGACIINLEVGDTLECQVASSADTSYSVVASISTAMNIFSLPDEDSQAVLLDTVNWRVDANISGANASLGTLDVSSYTGIENGSLALTNNAGNGVLAAQIPCSSTNPPTGTTCSAGNESIGVSFTLPAAGDVLACVTASWFMSAPGSIDGALQIVETPNSAQTISQEGKSRVAVAMDNTITTFPARTCGTFSFASAGQKTLRLFYEQDVTGTINSSFILADASANIGQRDVHWEIYPVNQSMPVPFLIGSVTSNTTGAERIERAIIACNAASSITSQSGSWLSAVGNRSSTACTITIAAGAFSAKPTCLFVMSTTRQATAADLTSATAGTLYGDSSDYAGQLICMGPR